MRIVWLLGLVVCSCAAIDLDYDFASPEEALAWVYSNVVYTDDLTTHSVADFWSYPTETLARCSGDCEDLALLLGYWLKQRFGMPVEFSYQVYLNGAPGEVLSYHFAVVVGNDYYDPTTDASVSHGKPFDAFAEISRHSYDFIFSQIKYHRGLDNV